jgi:tRNA-modifying protein YgfZ
MLAPQSGYAAALNKAAFYIYPDGGYLRVSGPDRGQFLQRQTSNDIRQLSAGSAQLSVLTNPMARIIDVFYIFNEIEKTPNFPGQAPAIGMLTLPGKSKSTYQYLKSRIFFMDQVTISDHSQEFSQVELFGPLTLHLLQALGFSQRPHAQQILGNATGEFSVWGLGHEPAFGFGSRLIVPTQSLGTLVDTLINNGAEPASTETYQILRIEAGLPGSNHELTDRFTPLECGLRVAISETKGCYTGQEVIARQINYDKVSHTLCGIKLEMSCPEETPISFEGKPVGMLTSYAHSPRFNEIGLALIRRPYDKLGAVIQAGAQTVRICEIPFQ